MDASTEKGKSSNIKRMIFFLMELRILELTDTYFPAKSMVKSKNDSSNDPKASTDSSTTLEDDDSKGKASQGTLVFSKRTLRNIKVLHDPQPRYWIRNPSSVCNVTTH